jgi:hypothetical protein
MPLTHSLARWGGARLSRRLVRSVPLVGAAVAFATVGMAVRRKGLIGGAVDTGLNAIPLVGALKAGVEWIRGRDLIADRPESRSPDR